MYARCERTCMSIRVHTRVHVRAFVCVYVRCSYACVGPQTCGVHMRIHTANAWAHIGTCSIYRVGFRSGDAQWAFDTTRSIERLAFSISGVLSRGKISMHRRMPEKYFDTVLPVAVCTYIHVPVETMCLRRKDFRYEKISRLHFYVCY